MSEQKYIPWPHIIGWSVLLHVILLTCSIIEVVIYSMLINPGKSEKFYTETC